MECQIELTNGYYLWYLAHGGSEIGRQLTTARGLTVEWGSSQEQQWATLTLTCNLNIVTPFDWKAAGDVYIGEGISGGVDNFVSQQTFTSPTRYNVLQEGTRVRVLMGGVVHFSGYITTISMVATAEGQRVLTAQAIDELGVRAKALACGPTSTTHQPLPIELRTPTQRLVEVALADAFHFADNEIPGRACYSFPWTATDAWYTWLTPGAGLGDTLQVPIADGAGTSATDQFGRTFYTSALIVTNLPDTAVPEWPCTGYIRLADVLIPHSNDELIRYYGLVQTGGYWAFANCYRGCAGTTRHAWQDGGLNTVISHIVPAHIAVDQVVVKHTVPLNGSPSSKAEPLASDKVGIQPDFAAFAMAEPHPYTPLLATCSVYDYGATPDANSDLDGDGMVTALDVFKALAQGPEDAGGPAIPDGNLLLPTALRAWQLDFYTLSPLLLTGIPWLEAWNQFVQAAGLERQLGMYYDAEQNKLVLYLMGLDGTGDDLTITEGVVRREFGTNINDTYLKGYMTARDFTSYNSLALGNDSGHRRLLFGDVEALALDSDSEIEIYIVNYTNDGVFSDEYEYDHLDASVALTGTRRNVRFQDYTLAANWTLARQRRVFRHLTDGRTDTVVRFLFPSNLAATAIASEGQPFIYAVAWFNEAGDPEEIDAALFSLNTGGSGEVRVVMEGTVDAAFDPTDVRGAGHNAFAYDDLEWKPLDANLILHVKGQTPEFYTTEEVPPGNMRAARAVRLAFYSVAGTRNVEEGFKYFAGIGEWVVRTRNTRAVFAEVTTDTGLAGQPGYIVGIPARQKLHGARWAVQTDSLGVIGTGLAQCIVRGSVVDSYRQRQIHTYNVTRTAGNAAALDAAPIHHGQKLTISSSLGGDTRTLMVHRWHRRIAWVGSPTDGRVEDEVTLHGYDPTGSITI